MTVESKAKVRTSADHTADLSLVPGDLESSPTGSPVVRAVTPHVLSPQLTPPQDAGHRAALHIHFSRLCLSPSSSPAPRFHLSKAKPTHCSHWHLRAGTPNTCPTPQMKETKASSFLSIITHGSPLSPLPPPSPLASQGPPRVLPRPSGHPHSPLHRSPNQSQSFPLLSSRPLGNPTL